MVFNSISFLIFFGVFFILYWVINKKFNTDIRNAFTTIASYLFYGWWDWRFLILIAFSSLTDFVLGQLLFKSTTKKRRKLLLASSLFVNLGILGVFKYYNFFIESFEEILHLFSTSINTSTLNIILPVGISFYTFQTLSYTIDIYNKKVEPTKNIISFFAFVSFFPQLVAGPIERYSHLIKQFQETKTFSYKRCTEGLRLILWGFFKKIVIADNFGLLTDTVFNSNQSLSGTTVLLGTIFFSLQIYADFSGYSDIAIGASKMLGYDLMTNFKTPYFSKSFSEFWRRWHISLSTWFRDYVYIPLGGNKKGNTRLHINLLVTFLLSGLWHGANITFLIWGGLHGLMLILEKHFGSKISKYLYTPFVLLMVILLWLPFRAIDFQHLKEYTIALSDVSSYSLNQFHELLTIYTPTRFIGLSITLLFFLRLEYLMKENDFNNWLKVKSKTYRFLVYYTLLFAILIIGNFDVKPSFIYFQF